MAASLWQGSDRAAWISLGASVFIHGAILLFILHKPMQPAAGNRQPAAISVDLTDARVFAAMGDKTKPNPASAADAPGEKDVKQARPPADREANDSEAPSGQPKDAAETGADAKAGGGQQGPEKPAGGAPAASGAVENTTAPPAPAEAPAQQEEAARSAAPSDAPPESQAAAGPGSDGERQPASQAQPAPRPKTDAAPRKSGQSSQAADAAEDENASSGEPAENLAHRKRASRREVKREREERRRAGRAKEAGAGKKPARHEGGAKRHGRPKGGRPGAASASGRAGASPGAVSNYAALVRARIAQHKPASGPAPGSAMVAFSLSRSGGLLAARVSRSSGNAALDQAALGAVRRAAPFPPPPAGMSPAQLRFFIPFYFR